MMLAIKLATHVGNFVKRFLEGTCVSYWIGKLFPPIVMVAIVQPDMT
jgi:xanthine/uracil permease